MDLARLGIRSLGELSYWIVGVSKHREATLNRILADIATHLRIGKEDLIDEPWGR